VFDHFCVEHSVDSLISAGLAKTIGAGRVKRGARSVIRSQPQWQVVQQMPAALGRRMRRYAARMTNIESRGAVIIPPTIGAAIRRITPGLCRLSAEQSAKRLADVLRRGCGRIRVGGRLLLRGRTAGTAAECDLARGARIGFSLGE
jgi:hypothetical protein